MNYIIFDLEATCWDKDEHPASEMEIIEIGAIKFRKNPAGHWDKSEFNVFVKPTIHPELSSFCKKLTSITQKDVDGALPFETVLPLFQHFIGVGREEYLLCSWGFYDRKQLAQDCKLWRKDTKWLKPHISLKHQFAGRRKMGVSAALKKIGKAFKGMHHRGIDDARNIFEIFIYNFSNWDFTPMSLPTPSKKKVENENVTTQSNKEDQPGEG